MCVKVHYVWPIYKKTIIQKYQNQIFLNWHKTSIMVIWKIKGTANSLFHTGIAACKKNRQDEEVSEARTKLFSCGIAWVHQLFSLQCLQVIN